MKLPNLNLATVEREKITDYLLNTQHRYGASKERFFAEFGFKIEDWRVLADALLDHSRKNEVARESETGFGTRYTVEGELEIPSGRRPRVRTVWQLDKNLVAPRLISAYPLEAEL